jgi:hypothetical protein
MQKRILFCFLSILQIAMAQRHTKKKTAFHVFCCCKRIRYGTGQHCKNPII